LILKSQDESSIFLGSHFLYLYIQENINLIIESTEKFFNIKDLLFNQIIQKCEFFSPLIIKRICYSISIILAVGSLTINSSFIQDIVEFGKDSFINCYISVIILNSVYFEFGKLTFNNEIIKMKITYKLKENMPIVLEYLNFLLQNFNLSDNNINENTHNNFKNFHLENICINSRSKINIHEIRSEIFDLINSLIRLDINILFIPEIFHILIYSFEFKNSEKVSFIIADCIKYLDSAKLYANLDSYNLNNIISLIKVEHYQILEGLLNFINNSVKNILEKNSLHNFKNFNLPEEENLYLENRKKFIFEIQEKDKNSIKKIDSENIELLAALAYIFAAILENYVYFIFLNNSLSQIIYNNFLFFLSCKNLRISSKMFKPLEEICFFLKESNFEENPENITINSEKTIDQIKSEIIFFLINITSLIMFNCKFKKITIPILSQERIITNFNKIDLEEENDFDSDDNKFLRVSDYRIQANEAYFDIFSVFIENLRQDGVRSFFNFLNDIIEKNDLNKIIESSLDSKFQRVDNNKELISEKEKNEKVHLIEVIIHLLRSIAQYVFFSDQYIDLLLEISLKLFNTQVIHNEFILCSFLLFLNDIAQIVPKNKCLFMKTMELFIHTLNNKQFQIISTDTLVFISEYCDEPQEDIFYFLYKVYQENFDIFEEKSLLNLSSALFNLIYQINIPQTNYIENFDYNQIAFKKYSHDQIIVFLEGIFTPVKTSLDKLSNFIKDSEFINNIEKKLVNEDYVYFLNDKIIEQIKITFIKDMTVYISFFAKKYIPINIFLKVYNNLYNNTRNILDLFIKISVIDSKSLETIFKLLNEIFGKNIFENLPISQLDFFSESFAHIFSLITDTFLKNPNIENCLELINKVTKCLIVSPSEKKEILYSKFLLIIEKMDQFYNNKEGNYFDQSLSQYLYLWVQILKSGISFLFFDFKKFSTLIDTSIDIVLGNSMIPSELFDNFIDFISEIFNNKNNFCRNIFTKDFFQNKSEKLIKKIIVMICHFNDIEIEKVIF